jgi:iron complex outermembrane recepter protein
MRGHAMTVRKTRMNVTRAGLGALLLSTVAILAIAPQAIAQTVRQFSIPAQSVSSALVRYSTLTGVNLVYDGELSGGLRSSAVNGQLSQEQALGQLLAGTGLTYRFGANDTVTIIAPQQVGAAVGGDATTLEAIVLQGGDAPGSYEAAESSVGTKTDTPLRDVPQSIQVVKRSVLEDQQATSLTQALENVSNVRESSTAGNRAATFITRGFASNTYAIDGSVLNATGSRPEVNPDLAGVERVEVLKGPASVLYGRGEPGGLINIVTRRPTEELTAEATTQIGSYGFRRAEATASGALSEDGAWTGRITGAAQRESGFVDYRQESERQYIGGVLEWSPDEDTRVNLSVDHTRQEQPYDRGLIIGADDEIVGPYHRFLGEDWSMVDSRKTRIALTAEHQALEWLKFRSTVRYDDALTHDTGIDFEDLLDDGRTLERRYTDRIEDMNNLDLQFEGIMTFDTGNIGHTVLAGVQHVRSRMDFWRARSDIAPIDIYDPVYRAPMPPATSGRLEYVQDIIASSVYLQDQIDFSDQWKMLAGLRYDRFENDTRYQVGDGDPNSSDGAVTWRAGLVYQPTDHLSFYTSYSTSFMPQAGLGEGNTALDPEEGWQIEAGVKADISDRLSATFAVFNIVKSNVAVEVPGEDYSRLTGEQRSRGAELDVTGEISDGWQVIASLGYVDAEVTEDADASIVGNQLVGAPHWSGSLWTTYEFQTGKLEGLKVGAGITAVGERTGDLDNSFFVDGYYRVDASVSYKVTENLDFSLIGRNLTNQDYIESTAGRTENHPGAPMNFMAAVKATF